MSRLQVSPRPLDTHFLGMYSIKKYTFAMPSQRNILYPQSLKEIKEINLGQEKDLKEKDSNNTLLTDEDLEKVDLDKKNSSEKSDEANSKDTLSDKTENDSDDTSEDTSDVISEDTKKKKHNRL